MKARVSLLLFASLLFSGCFWGSVKKDFVLLSGYDPQKYQKLAVINVDPQVRFSEYVEAELLRKGYQVKESSLVRQVLKKEELKEESLDPTSLARIGSLLDVQGVVLCSVLEFSRFRDAYRLNIKMVSAASGETIWAGQGAMDGKKGQRTGELLSQIVTASMAKLPPVKNKGKGA